MQQKVIFNTIGGKRIESIMEMNNHEEVIAFVDEYDYITVEINGVYNIIPKEKIDSFEVQAV